MLGLNTRKLSTTLFISLAILVALSTVVEAAHEPPVARHGSLRIVKVHKRQEADAPGPVIGAAPIPGQTSTPVQSASGGPGGVPPITASSAASSSTVSSASSASSSASVSASASSSSSRSSSSSSSSTSTTSSSTSSQEPTTTPAPSPSEQVVTVKGKVQTKTFVTSVEAQATEAPPALAGAAKTSGDVATILIAVAASIGGVAILWTIFRKWKLGSSKKFEERMQPIDWRTPSHEDDAGIIPANRRNSGSSFHSSGANSRNGHGNSSGLQPIPDHDFTATGASPVGGYADMNRGTSPGPYMRERGYEYGAPINSGRY